MKINIICVAYQRPVRLRGLIDSFIVQTDQNWSLQICHDGPATDEIWKVLDLYKISHKNGISHDGKIEFWETPKRNGLYGHPNRRTMLENLKGDKNDYVLITNDDNYYVPRYVEFMLKMAAPNVGIIYCDTDHSHAEYDTDFIMCRRPELLEHHIDMGAFIVKLDLAKEVGFNYTHCKAKDYFSADGVYAEECNAKRIEKGLRSTYIRKLLFVHN